MLLGTAGHVDHGKTTLVRALTGVDCDRLQEEKQRGITIELGFAGWTLPSGRRVSVVDVPGHEKLVRTMLVGAGGIDAVLLVVAATAGVMPQTREHVAACEVLGVRRGVVAVTFADRVEDIAQAIAGIRAELRGTFLAGAPCVPVAAPLGAGLDALTAEVERLLDAVPAPEAELPACLPVDRVFSRAGFGTVVTGSLLRGRLAVDQLVDLVPGPRGVRVRGLQIHGTSVSAALPGARVAVNLVVDRAAVARNAIVAEAGTVALGRVLDVELRWLDHLAAPLGRARGLGFHLAAAHALADVRADGAIEPGGRGTARIRLDREVPLPAGARFVLRGQADAQHGAVVGGGRLLDPQPPRRRSAEARRALAAAGPEEARALLVAEAGRRGLRPETLALRLPLPAVPAGPSLFAEAAVAHAAAELVAAVRAWHRDRPHDAGMPLVAPDPLRAAAQARALAEGRLRREGGVLSVPEHTAGLDEERQRLARKLLRAIGQAGLAGPPAGTLQARFPAPDADIADLLRYLEQAGRIVRSDGYCFPGREAHALRARAARAALAGAPVSVGWLKDEAGVTRRHAIPLLLWLDATGATARSGDVRLAGPRAAEYAREAET